MRLVWGAPEVAEVVADAAGHAPHFGNHRTAAVYDMSGSLSAGLVFHDWQPLTGTMEISIVATNPKWATRGVLTELGAYCFQTAGCQMIVARTDESNQRVRRLWKALGAQEYIIPRLRGRTASEAILTLTAEAWASSKFNRSAYAKLKSANAA